MKEHRIQVELDGIITLLARNLYSEPDLFLREMLQNAHDSVRRRALEGEAPPGRIDLVPGEDSLEIRDNGAGLSEAEVHTFLSTIGRSGTGELRARLEERGVEAARELIGQFGIGLLSAFTVAWRVEVRTRARGEAGLLWTSEGSRTYTLEAEERDEVGTTVRLVLRAEALRYTNPHKLRQVVRTWADFLGVPVHVDGEQANAGEPPWLAADAARASLSWWQQRLGPPLALLPLTEGDVQGVVGITADRSRGSIDLFVRRMLVERAAADLLPGWARFVRGVVQCDTLEPTAARDAIRRGEAFDALRHGLTSEIGRWLNRLYRDEPRLFAALARAHSRSLMEAALDPQAPLLAVPWDHIPVPTESGPALLADLQEGGRVHFVVEPVGAEQALLLCQARGLRVVDASDPVVERFVREACARVGAQAVELDLSRSQVIFGVPDDPSRFEALLGLAHSLPGMTAQVSAFEPTDLPALLVETRPQRARRELDEVRRELPVPGALQAAVDGYLSSTEDVPTLHLNARHRLVRALAERPTLDVLVALADRARLLLRPRLPLDELRAIYRRDVALLERLVDG